MKIWGAAGGIARRLTLTLYDRRRLFWHFFFAYFIRIHFLKSTKSAIGFADMGGQTL